MPKPSPVERATAAKRESRYVEFKEKFDPASDGEWCELLKDFAAIANSGSGIVVIGLRNNGTPAGTDIQPVLDLDPAKVTDKLFKYTGYNHSGFEIHETTRKGHKLAVIAIDSVRVPIVFTKPGTYLDSGSGKQKTAFSKGTVYARHGAKSEPATSDDLREFIERQIEIERRVWLGKMRQVMEAPSDAQIAIYRPISTDATGNPPQIQLTTDPNTPVYGKLDPDVTHPHRQKELVAAVNKKLSGKAKINAYDIRCARKVHNIDEQAAPQFCHLPKFGSMQYSEAFADWLLDQHTKDNEFFKKARKEYYDRTRASR